MTDVAWTKDQMNDNDQVAHSPPELTKLFLPLRAFENRYRFDFDSHNTVKTGISVKVENGVIVKFTLHHENMSVKKIPHFYIVKLGYAGYIYFSYFCSKHRLWVHVRTVSPRRF